MSALGYNLQIPIKEQQRLDELAEVALSGREMFHGAFEPGFFGHAGSEAEWISRSALGSDWPGGSWSKDEVDPFHLVGLMISQSAAGQLGELAALLRAGEVSYSAVLVGRGVIESCARLFRLYWRPFIGVDSNVGPTVAVCKSAFAAAYLEVMDAAFNAENLATKRSRSNPDSQVLTDQVESAAAERLRLTEAYGPLFERKDTTSRKRLMLDNFKISSMTDAVEEMIAEMWADSEAMPLAVYTVLSGYAHSSLDSQIHLFVNQESDGVATFTRTVPIEHIEYSVAICAVVFQQIFERLVTFYGLPSDEPRIYRQMLANAFPNIVLH